MFESEDSDIEDGQEVVRHKTKIVRGGKNLSYENTTVSFSY